MEIEVTQEEGAARIAAVPAAAQAAEPRAADPTPAQG